MGKLNIVICLLSLFLFKVNLGHDVTIELTATDDWQTLTSPPDDESFARRTLHMWTIRSLSNKAIQVKTVHFNLKPGNSSYVWIPEVGFFYEHTGPNFTSTGPYVDITFVENTTIAGENFTLQYRQTTGDPPMNGKSAKLTATENWKILSLPASPRDRILQPYYSWLLSSEPNTFIMVEGVDFKLHKPDYLEIYDGSDRPWHYTDYFGPPFLSSNNALHLVVHIGSWPKESPDHLLVFKLRYKQVTDELGRVNYGCDHIVPLKEAPHASFLYPAFPRGQNYTKCEWLIQGIEEHRIHLRQPLTLEKEECQAFLTIEDPESHPDILVKLCATRPFELVIRNSIALISLSWVEAEDSKTDWDHIMFLNISAQETSEPATFLGTCPKPGEGRELVAVPGMTGKIASKNFPFFTYDNGTQCQWLIHSTSPDHVVQLTVLVSDLQMQKRCFFERVSAYDGKDTSAAPLKKWCGKDKPVIQSSGPYLTLRFRSNKYGQWERRGFLIQYTAVPVQETSLWRDIAVIGIAVLAFLAVALVAVWMSCRWRDVCKRRRERNRLSAMFRSGGVDNRGYVRFDLGTSEDTPVSSEDSSVSREDASVSREDVSVSRGDASVSREDVSVSRGDVSVSRGDVSVSREDASVSREDASVSREDASVSRGDASVSRGDASV